MSDIDSAPQAAARFDIAKIVVLSGWSLTLAACLVIIVAYVCSAMARGDLAALTKEADMCIGFLLGAFVALVKEFIKVSA